MHRRVQGVTWGSFCEKNMKKWIPGLVASVMDVCFFYQAKVIFLYLSNMNLNLDWLRVYIYIYYDRVELLDKWMKRKRHYSYSIRLGLPHFGGKYCHTKSQKGSEGTKRDSDSRTAINFHYDSCCKDTVARFCLDTFWKVEGEMGWIWFP